MCFPVGQLPVLEIDGLTLYQSTAICRYLGRKLGLAGKDAKDAVMCDIMADNVNDLRVWLGMIFHEANAEAREQKREVVMNQVNLILTKMNQEATQNNGFLVGSQLTWVDFVLVGMSGYLCTMFGKDVFSERNALSKLRDTVRALPAVRLYCDKQQSH
ncbi:hypothetical protein B566_EDAN002209 [Ephemera danica]|nr:hypothetical protein B566_EDAN002209 [Ephemera danica]